MNITKSNIRFYNKTSEMPVEKLETEFTGDIVEDYDVCILDIKKVIGCIESGQTNYNIFCLDAKMIRLIEFIESENKLIPPIILNLNNNKWTFLDGQHRVALFLHLGISKAPFLIRKNQKNHIKELI